MSWIIETEAEREERRKRLIGHLEKVAAENGESLNVNFALTLHHRKMDQKVVENFGHDWHSLLAEYFSALET